MFVAKRALIISRDVSFSTDAKTGLERHGYEVTTYTNSRPALDYLRQNNQHVALLDFRVNDMPATDALDHMRAMQPNIIVVAAPDHPAVHNLKQRYNLQAIIEIPTPIRKLLSLLDDLIEQNPDAHLGSDESSDDEDAVHQKQQAQALEFWVSDTEDGDTVVEFVKAVEEGEGDELATRNFVKLAQEEPPMPAFEDNSTLSEVHKQLTDRDTIQRLVDGLSDEETLPGGEVVIPSTPEPEPEEEQVDEGDEVPSEESRSIPAARFLETALDQSTPIRTFSVQEFIEKVRERGNFEIAPLPSWLDDSDRYVREPDFLPSDLPALTTSVEYITARTAASQSQEEQVEHDPGALVTDQIEPVKRSQPADAALSDRPDSPPPSEIPDVLDDEITARSELSEAPVPAERIEETAGHPVTEASAPVEVEAPQSATLPFVEHDSDDPYIAQLSVTLTQMSLELTAEATLVARDGRIVAYAGKLPRGDIDDLREQLADDWESNEQKSRIRFITLPGSGADYMLYTRKTDSDYSLSMIFGGTIPLHVIRRQGKRLAEALAAVPEVVEEEASEAIPEDVFASPIYIPTLDEVGEREPYAFVWMLANPDAEIPAPVASEIVKSLDVQLAQGGWQVHTINVHQDFIFLFGDMPTSLMPQRIIRDLMHVSGDIINDMFPALDAETLWHDSYFVLHPGRELDTEDVQRFINFAREQSI